MGGLGDALTEGAASVSDQFEYWAFSNQPGFENLRDEYFNAAADLRQKVQDGGSIMRAMGERLKQIAAIYENVEDENRLDIQGA